MYTAASGLQIDRSNWGSVDLKVSLAARSFRDCHGLFVAVELTSVCRYTFMEIPTAKTMDVLLSAKEKADKTDQKASKRSHYSYDHLRLLADDAILILSKWLSHKVDELYSSMVNFQVSRPELAAKMHTSLLCTYLVVTPHFGAKWEHLSYGRLPVSLSSHRDTSVSFTSFCLIVAPWDCIDFTAT